MFNCFIEGNEYDKFTTNATMNIKPIIKRRVRIKNVDIQVIKACCKALDRSTSKHMLIANLNFILDRYVNHPSK